MVPNIHVDVRVPRLVALEVDLQVALGGKPVPTDVTLVRALAGVGPNVDLEGTVTSKYLVTESAFVTEEGIISTELWVKNRDIGRLGFVASRKQTLMIRERWRNSKWVVRHMPVCMLLKHLKR